jgi:predicted ArsR family transcriptional regulator
VTLPRRATDVEARRARALGDPTRRAILEHLEATATDVRSLAARCGLHPNAVRQHLAVLTDAGLVTDDLDRAAGRVGRPRRLYRAATAVNPFEWLARLLVDVAVGAEPIERGRAEGAALAADLAGTESDPAQVVARIAGSHGFATRIHRQSTGAVVALDGCPFAAVAGPIVCALHHGIVEGAAHTAGGAVTSFAVADPAIGPCEVTLTPDTGASS